MVTPDRAVDAVRERYPGVEVGSVARLVEAAVVDENLEQLNR